MSACDTLNPKVDIPSYVTIDSISLQVSNPNEFGSASQNITDAWVIFDDNIQGVYELPASFPILKSGSHNIRIRPGIKINGIASTRAFYIYYTSFTQNIELVPGKDVTINPVVDYDPTTTMVYIEDFEDGGVKLNQTSNSEGSFFKTNNPDDVFEDSFSGVMSLLQGENFGRVTSLITEPLDLPRGGLSVFLELDYKNNHKFSAGLVGVYQDGTQAFVPALNLNPRSDWNKVYINLTNVINNSIPDAMFYLIYFQVNRETTSDDIEIFLDNIKVVR